MSGRSRFSPKVRIARLLAGSGYLLTPFSVELIATRADFGPTERRRRRARDH
jgi:hypothetical protein